MVCPGTGLGLHIVAKYAELMNGRINCESEIEKGTTMTVRFNFLKSGKDETTGEVSPETSQTNTRS